MRLCLCIYSLVLLCSWMTSVSALPNHVIPSTGSTEVLLNKSGSSLFESGQDVAVMTKSRPKRMSRNNRNLFAINHYIGFGWFCYYNALDLVAPPASFAIQDMEHFLSGVLSLAGSVWANEPDERVRVAAIGQLILKMTSNEPIPWHWIHGYLLGAVCLSQSPIAFHYACVLQLQIMDGE